MVTSVIRTWSPIAAGWLISLPLAHPVIDLLGVDTPTAERATAGAVASLAAAGYYLAARWAERRWPAVGVLLGRPAQPVYAPPGAPVQQDRSVSAGAVGGGYGRTLADPEETQAPAGRITVRVSTRDGVTRGLTFAPNMLVGHAAETAAAQLGEDHTNATFAGDGNVYDRGQTLAKAGIRHGDTLRLVAPGDLP